MDGSKSLRASGAPIAAAAAAPRSRDDGDLLEALLRHDTAAAADLPPVSWSMADSLMDQGYAVADETIRGVHREKDDPALFGIWNALVTRMIATS